VFLLIFVIPASGGNCKGLVRSEAFLPRNAWVIAKNGAFLFMILSFLYMNAAFLAKNGGGLAKSGGALAKSCGVLVKSG
jgi:hypothetical protein